jgi:small subunit ribosomal protein S17e|eukprot:8427-Pelagococcus_subviridis.AAC.6
MKRIQRGPVRGISLKLQEEERERRMDFVPDESALAVETIEVDRDTMDMLKSLNMGNLPGVTLQTRGGNRGGFQRKEGGGGGRN